MNKRVQNREKMALRQGKAAVVQVIARHVRKGMWPIAAWGFILCGLPHFGAPSEPTAEYPVKLAFLYQFAQYVQWPSESFQTTTAPLVVCVFGEDPFDPDLERELESEQVDQHPVLVRRAKRGANLKTCHMVFVPTVESKQAASIIESLKGAPVLTIGETKGFAERGGIINFTIDQNKLHFEINLDAAQQTPLRISSRVLALARIVRAPPQP